MTTTDDEVATKLKQRQLATVQCLDAIAGLDNWDRVRVLRTVAVFYDIDQHFAREKF
jgi:hypothetical protein